MGSGTTTGGFDGWNGPSPGGVGSPTPTPDELQWIFDIPLSFGHGTVGVDDLLPFTGGGAPETFWMSPTLLAAGAIAGQVREWVTLDNLSQLGLIVRVDAASLTGDGGQLIVTVDGVDSPINVSLPPGATADTTLTGAGPVAVAAGSKIGVRWLGGANMTAGSLRAEIRLRGLWSGTAPAPPAAVFHVMGDAGLAPVAGKVVLWEDQGALGQDLDQTVLGKEPDYVASAINGIPGVSFPAWPSLDQRPIYRNANLKRDALNDFASGDPRTIYVVMIPRFADGTGGGGTHTAGATMQFRGGVGNYFTARGENFSVANVFRTYTNGGGILLDRPSAIGSGYDGSPVIVKWVYDGANVYCYVNNTLIVTTAFGGNPADTAVGTFFFLGGNDLLASNTFAGTICEAAVFSGVLSAINQAVFESYLSTKYGIPL